jgi:hypothetical protein
MEWGKPPLIADIGYCFISIPNLKTTKTTTIATNEAGTALVFWEK